MTLSGHPARRFTADVMLGKLAKWLRILGFDTTWERITDAARIIGEQRRGRLVLTRNTRWRDVDGILWIAENAPMDQLRRVVHDQSIHPGEVRLLRRCILDNEPLNLVAKEDAFARVPDYILQTHDRFLSCAKCGRIYWRGSHHGRMIARLSEALDWPINPMEKERRNEQCP